MFFRKNVPFYCVLISFLFVNAFSAEQKKAINRHQVEACCEDKQSLFENMTESIVKKFVDNQHRLQIPDSYVKKIQINISKRLVDVYLASRERDAEHDAERKVAHDTQSSGCFCGRQKQQENKPSFKIPVQLNMDCFGIFVACQEHEFRNHFEANKNLVFERLKMQSSQKPE